MSRLMVLAFLLLTLMITSQFEWKQQLVNDLDPNQGIPVEQQRVVEKGAVKEKIILSQEKTIQRLNKLVHTLQQQLLQCQGANKSLDSSKNSLVININKTEWQQHAQED